jgi:hypothetical protein
MSQSRPSAVCHLPWFPNPYLPQDMEARQGFTGSPLGPDSRACNAKKLPKQTKQITVTATFVWYLGCSELLLEMFGAGAHGFLLL